MDSISSENWHRITFNTAILTEKLIEDYIASSHGPKFGGPEPYTAPKHPATFAISEPEILSDKSPLLKQFIVHPQALLLHQNIAFMAKLSVRSGMLKHQKCVKLLVLLPFP
jgi:hypothetical protein